MKSCYCSTTNFARRSPSAVERGHKGSQVGAGKQVPLSSTKYLQEWTFPSHPGFFCHINITLGWGKARYCVICPLWLLQWTQWTLGRPSLLAQASQDKFRQTPSLLTSCINGFSYSKCHFFPPETLHLCLSSIFRQPVNTFKKTSPNLLAHWGFSQQPHRPM